MSDSDIGRHDPAVDAAGGDTDGENARAHNAGARNVAAGDADAGNAAGPNNAAGPDNDTDPDNDGHPGWSDAGGPTSPAARALDDVGSYIRQQRESAALSLRKLAKLAGVSNPYLSQIERGLRKPSADILQGIAKALEISSETLYVKAGILEERADGLSVEEAVARDEELTDAQRDALVEMYRSFVSASQLRPPLRRRPRRGLGQAGTHEDSGTAHDAAP